MIWENTTIAIVAGDAGEQEIARCAVRARAKVRAYGFPWPDAGIDGVYHAKNATDALKDADFALFPIPGITAEGALFAPKNPDKIIPTREMLAGMRRPGHIILGWADPNLKRLCEELGITLHEYEWDTDLMLLRGPAIVEGVLKVIIENTSITIHKSNICLVGQGTIGSLLTKTLIGLGANVHVAARNPVQRASAYAAGAEPLLLEELSNILPRIDIVIGSIPKRVIERDLLTSLSSEACAVDCAAAASTINRN